MKMRFWALLCAAALALLTVPAAAQANPDIQVTKGCQLDPAHGATAVMCVINVVNGGNANSISPITLRDCLKSRSDQSTLRNENNMLRANFTAKLVPIGRGQ